MAIIRRLTCYPAVLFLLTLAAPVLAQTGTIQGHVLDTSAIGVPGIGVQLEYPDGTFVAGTSSGAGGAYVVNDVPVGEYIVRALSSAGLGLVGQYYRGVSESDPDLATRLIVTDGATLPDIDLQVEHGGSISGALMGLGGQTITMRLEDAVSGRSRGQVITSAGTYTIPLVAPGSYRVFADVSGTTLALQWFDGQVVRNRATVVTIGAGQDVASIDFTLEGGGAISGAIALNPGPGAPETFQQMWVQAFDAATFDWVSSCQVAAGGTYEIANLPTGRYIVEVQTGSTNYIREVWTDTGADTDDYSEATPIEVMAGATAGSKDFALELGGAIQGHLFLDADGNGSQNGEAAVAGANVWANLTTGSYGAGSGSDASGDYTIFGLRPGTYQVGVEGGWSTAGFVPERWDGHSVFGDAWDPVEVIAGDTAVANFSLRPGVEISGRVFQDVNGTKIFDAGDRPITNGTVRFSDFDTGRCCTHAQIWPDGTYRIQLLSGRYRAEAWDSNSVCIRLFWNNVFFSDEASPIDLSTGPKPNIDFRLTVGAEIGVLQGVVVGGSPAVPVPGVDVSVERYGTGEGVAGASTDASGRFVLFNLPPGSYEVRFDTQRTNTQHDTDLQTGYWSSGGDRQVAFPAVPGVGSDLGTFTLGLGGSISGVVTTDGGALPAGTYVQPQAADGTWLSRAAVDPATGAYRIRGVPAPGSYRVQAGAGESDYVVVYYVSQSESSYDSNRAAFVPVAAGLDTSGIDLHLFVGGSITGQVTAEGGAPLESVSIAARRIEGGYWTNAVTDADGRYALRGLPSGSYEVRLDQRTGAYANQYYPTLVPVTAPAETPDIDFVLTAGGAIRGRVTRVSDGTPVANLRIQAEEYPGGRFVSDARTDQNGDYVINAVSLGAQYRVRAMTDDDPAQFPLVAMYFHNRNWADEADTVTVPVDTGEATGIDFALPVAAIIEGRVTLADDPADAAEILPQMGVDVVDATTYHGLSWRGLAADGTFRFANLPAGTYVLRVNAWATDYISRVWTAGGLDVEDWNQATPITVDADHPASGKDFTLARGFAISGHLFLDNLTVNGVQDPGEPDVAGASVNASQVDGNSSRGATSDATGHYMLRGLRRGHYQVAVSMDIASPGFVAERWDGHTALDGTYDAIDLTSGDATADFSLVEGREISGEVYHDVGNDGHRDAGDPSITNGTVGVGDYNTGWCCVYAPVRADGTYVVQVPPGRYRVQAWDDQGLYLAEYWDNAYFSEAASEVDVQDESAPNISFGLATASLVGLLQGTVVGGDPAVGIPSVQVHVQRFDPQFGYDVANAWTDAAGHFAFTNLPPGQYRVYFDTATANGLNNHDFVSAYWTTMGEPGWIDWNDLLVDLTATAGAGKDLGTFALAEGGSISGTVHLPAGDSGPLPSWVSIESFESGGSSLLGGQVDPDTGAYRVRGLPAPASYRVEVGWDSGFVRVYYYCSISGSCQAESTWDYNLATSVEVEANHETLSIDLYPFRGGSIAGTVRNGSGDPLSGVPINATLQGYNFWANASTGPDGTYLVTGLVNGFYTVRTDLRTGSYANQSHGDIEVAGLGAVEGVDFTLGASGTIRGRVTQTVDGAEVGVVNMRVQADDFDTGDFVSDARTDEAGYYTISALPQGRRYRVQTQPRDNPDPQFFNFVKAYWNGRLFWSDADPVPASGGLGALEEHVDFHVALGGAISGYVTDDETGLALQNVNIQAWDFVRGDYVNGDTTDQHGFYIIRGLPPGQYRVGTWLQGQNYVREYWEHTLDSSLATPVIVPPVTGTIPIVDGIDFGLTPGRRISGTVTKADGGAPVGSLQVSVSGTDVNYWDNTTTGPDGIYTVAGLPDGHYRVTVETSGTDYAQQSRDAHVSGSDATGVDFALLPGARLRGLTYEDGNHNGTYDAGEECANVQVQVYDWTTGEGVASGTSGADGSYEVSGLPAGTFRLQSEPDARNYVRLYYDNTVYYNEASPVAVAVGETIESLDFRLIKGHEISGLAFFDANGNGARDTGEPVLSNLTIRADRSDWQYGHGTNTAADGTYTLHGLLQGAYRVYAWAQGTPYASEYFKVVGDLAVGTYDQNDADLVGVTSVDASDIDFSLNLGGGVTGIVRDNDETPIAGADVNVNAFAGSGFGYGTRTGSDGRYLITGLPPGQYRAYASDSQGLFVGEYYIDKLFYDDANPLAVSARATVDDTLAAVADFSLGPAVAIEGVVYDDTNGNGTRDGGEAGIGGVQIQVNEFASTNRGIRGATTAADGTYHVGGLPADTQLRVQAQAWPSDFISVWYDDGDDLGTTDMWAATPVEVSADTKPGVNFALLAGGAIAGTVVDGNGDPLSNMYVNASGLAATPGGSGDSTSSTGQFVLHALAPGTYRVTAGDSSSAYGVEVYDNQRDNNAATPVGVAAGLTTSGINVVLPSQPTIVSVSPTDDIQRGEEATIQVTGTRLAGGDCSTTSVPCARVEVGGGGVTIVSSSLDEGTGTFSVGIRLASDAPLGGRSVSIVNDFPLEDAAAVMANALTVVPRETGDTPATSAEYAYLVDGGLSEVEVYQTADNSFVRTIPVAGQPSAVTLSPDGHFLYTSSGDRVIGVVDTRLGKEVARIPVDGNQAFNAIAATSRFVFVVDRRLNDRVRVIDTKSWTVVTEIVLGPNAIPYGVEADPLGRWVYAAILNPPHVAVFDADPPAGSLPAIVSTVSLPPGSSPRGMAFTPDGSRAYVVSSTNTYVIDTALAAVPETPETVGQALIDTDGDPSNGKTTPLPTRGGGAGLIEIAPFPGSPGTLLAYIPVNNNRIWVVDVSTDQPRIVRDVVAGYLPRMIRATSDGARVFVSHVGSLDYYVLDAANLLLSQPQIPVSLTRFASSVAPSGVLAVGPIPPAPPSTAPVVAGVTLPGGSPARNGVPFTIEVTGDHFGANPIVWLQDTNVHGTVTGASSTSLTVELPATTPAGDHVVIVSNPLDGGNESGIAPTTFAVRPPESFAPTQSVLSVSYVKASLTVLAPDGSTDVIPTQAFTNGLSLTPDGRLAVLTSFSSGPQTSGDVLPDSYCDASIIDLDPASTTFGQTVSKVPVAFGYFSNPAVTPNADNPNGVFVYVPDYQMDLITVIDPATQAEVDIDNDPATQSIQPDDENWWPLSEQLAARLQGINRIELRDNPTMGVMITTDVGITPDGSLLYVTNQGYPGDGYYPEFPAQVTIVDTVTRQVVGALQKGGNGDISQATAVAITPSRPGLLPQDVYVYVVGLDATGSPALLVYRANELHDETAFVARVPVPETTRGIVVSPDGLTVYLTARYAGDILAINVTPVAGGIDGTIHTVHAQTGVMELVVAPDDGLLYVAQGFTTALFVYDIVADPMTPAFVTSLGVPESPVALAVLPTLLRPRIGVVSPTNGDPTGGTPVVLTGANFAPGATVTFGGVQATGVTVVNAYLITAVAPAGAGVVDIKVTNPDGQYDVLSGRFTYLGDVTPPVFTTPPYVLSLTPVGTTVEAIIRWRTDEPSTSVVDFGVGGLSQQVSDASPLTTHLVTLPGLLPGESYLMRATSADAEGNAASSPASPDTVSFHTPTLPDLTPPVITDGPAVSTTTTAATVTWTTDEPATTVVWFAVKDHAMTERSVAGFKADHALTLTGLASNTTYQYSVASTDANANGPTTSAVGTFRTVATPLEFELLPSVSYLSNNLVIITWTTNNPSTSFVNYGVSSINEQTVVDTDLDTVHIVCLTNLLRGTAYGFQAGSTDSSGNTVLTADPFLAAPMMTMGTTRLAAPMKAGAVTLEAGTLLTTAAPSTGFTTPQAPDTTPPGITAPVTVVPLGSDRVLVTVATDEAASCLVRFGIGTPDRTVFDAAFTLSHSLMLTGLAAATTYRLDAVLTDPKGNATTVSGLLFVTPAAPDTTPPVVTGLAVSSVTATSAVVSWVTNEPASTTAGYGLQGGPLDAQAGVPGLATTHEASLTGLAAGTAYGVVGISRDGSGNQTVSSPMTFTTAFLPPQITSFVPPRAGQGATLAVTINGARFDADATASFGAGVTVTHPHVNPAGTQMTADLAVTALAASGPRTVTVTNPRSGLSASAVYEIVDETAPAVLITSPLDGAEVPGRTFVVRGTVNEPAVVTVNGVAAIVGAGAPAPFDATITVPGIGTHDVVAVATDPAGNQGTARITVRLVDDVPPSLSLTVTPMILWPVNHQMVRVVVGVTVSDNSDPSPTVELVSVTSSEPDDAPGAGDGHTVNDIQGASIGTDDREVFLRAERDGTRPGRVYLLTYRATDQAGNRVTAQVYVVVPHNPLLVLIWLWLVTFLHL